jgi:hypothetical protein
MTTVKKKCLEFSDVTDIERDEIIKFIRDPRNKEQANSNKNFHCMVILLFYHKKKYNSYSQNMRLSVIGWFVYLSFIDLD